MAEFPFICFRHGEVDADYLDKCEEVFLWFERAPTLSERKRIVASCPEPIAGDFTWGETFTYFGSAGDTYDFEIAANYGPDWFKEALEEDDWAVLDRVYEIIWDALEEFTEAVDAWLNEVHELVGISFFSGLWVASPDSDWAQWSTAHASEARARMDAHAAENPWLRSPDSAGEELVEPQKDKAKAPRVDKYLIESAPRERVATVFGWIYERVTSLVAEGMSPEERAELHAELAETMGPNDVVQKSHTLMLRGKYHEARAILDAFVAGGGKATRDVLVNYTAVVRKSTPDDLPTLLDMFEQAVRSNDELLTDPILMENVISALNERGRADESIELVKDAVEAGLPWNARIVTNVAFSAFKAGKTPWRAWVVETTNSLKQTEPDMLADYPLVYLNLACVAADDGRNDDAFDDLETMIGLNSRLRRDALDDSDLAPLHDDPRWQAIVDG